jgi:hypothetical protein
VRRDADRDTDADSPARGGNADARRSSNDASY